jgi:SAM-dependent methyltransferase
VYYPTEPINRAHVEKKIDRFQKDKMALVRRHCPGGSLLDVGCGVGHFVREAALAGYDASGIELSQEAIAFGRKTWGLPIKQGDLLEVNFPKKSFDVITLWQVLEHLAHPNESLEEIHKLLRDSGILVIAVPNLSSVQARLFRGRWYHLDVPRHLFHYDPGSLRKLLANHGFKVLSEHHHDTEHNWAGIMGSVIPFSPLRRSRAGIAVRRLVGKPVCSLLAAIESGMGSGGTFTYCAEKIS